MQHFFLNFLFRLENKSLFNVKTVENQYFPRKNCYEYNPLSNQALSAITENTHSKLTICINSEKVNEYLKNCTKLFYQFLNNNPIDFNNNANIFNHKIIGLTMFGSISRGEKSPNDIDLYMFFDCSQQEIKYKKKYFNNLFEISSMIKNQHTHTCENFRDFLRQSGYNSDIFQVSISYDLIDRIIEKMQQSDEFIYKYLEDEETLSKLFHFTLTPEIFPYRKYIINKLLKIKEGEKLWKRILKGLIYWEGVYKFNSQTGYYKDKVRKYPETLAEAEIFYSGVTAD